MIQSENMNMKLTFILRCVRTLGGGLGLSLPFGPARRAWQHGRIEIARVGNLWYGQTFYEKSVLTLLLHRIDMARA